MDKNSAILNPREQDYRRNDVRLGALKSIIEDIHLTILVDNLKVKIKNIRTTYNRETAKLANLRKDWCGYR
ncbi:hypothetical protein HUJ04_011192 [Dendroctonus ponderosae]|nr:hypothetical protein HUJ04_011192 [Dendroctonus ponderosae]